MVCVQVTPVYQYSVSIYFYENTPLFREIEQEYFHEKSHNFRKNIYFVSDEYQVVEEQQTTQRKILY